MGLFDIPFFLFCTISKEVSISELPESVFKGHTNWVRAVAFSPDGKILASGSADNTVKLWDVKTQSIIKTLKEHKGKVTTVVFSPDGQMLASGAEDKTIILWKCTRGTSTFGGRNGEVIEILKGHTGEIWTLAFSPDGKTLASGGTDKTIRLWNVKERNQIAQLKGHNDNVSSIAFSPDGEFLISGSWDRTVRVWRVSDFTLIHTLKGPIRGHKDCVTSVSVSSDGSLIASGSWDNTIKIWRLKDGKLLKTLSGHTEDVTSLCISPKGDVLISGGADNILRLWDINTGKCISFVNLKGVLSNLSFSSNGEFVAADAGPHSPDDIAIYKLELKKMTLKDFKRGALFVTFSPDGKIIAIGGEDNTVKLFNVEGGLVKTFEDLSGEPQKGIFSSNGGVLLSYNKNNSIDIFEVEKGEKIAKFENFKGNITVCAFESRRNILATGETNGAINLFSLSKKELIKTLKGHEKAVISIAFSPDGQILASGSEDNTVRLWKIPEGELIKEPIRSEKIISLCFSPNGELIAVGNNNNTLSLLKVKDGKIVNRIRTQSPPQSIAFSPSGDKIACIGKRTLQVFKEDGKPIISKEFSASAHEAVFSEDGEHILVDAGDKENDISLLEVKESREKESYPHITESSLLSPTPYTIKRPRDGKSFRIPFSTNEVRKVSMNPDGTRIAINDTKDKVVKIYNEKGEVKSILPGHKGIVTVVVFSPDGEILASGSADNTVKLWRVKNGELIRTLKGHSDWVLSLAFTPDSKILAASDASGFITLWTSDGNLINTLKAHRLGVWALAFSRDGEILASGSQDNTINLWRRNGELITSSNIPNSSIRCLAFSPKDNILAAAEGNSTIRFFEIPSLRQIHTRTFEGITSVEFEEDGKCIALNTQGDILMIDPCAFTIGDAEPPYIFVESPKDAEKVSKSEIDITGVALDNNKIAQVFINDKEVKRTRGISVTPEINIKAKTCLTVVKDKFSFREKVALIPGVNYINIQAYDVSGNKAERVITVQNERIRTLPKVWAFVIGVSDYEDPQIPDLKFGESDARAFCKFIKTYVPEENIVSYFNKGTTRVQIVKSLSILTKRISPNDLLIIYLAMHALPDPDGAPELYFLPYDAKLTNIIASGIGEFNIMKILQESNVNKILIIADCCHSGYVGLSSFRNIPGGVTPLLEKLAEVKPGISTLSASSAYELSREDRKWGGGVFTYYLLEGLKGSADVNKDKFITLREIYDYTYNKVKTATSGKQHPELKGTLEDYLPLSIVR